MTQRSATIIGGGVAGLALAVALARHSDWRVTVLEQAPALTEVGAGLQISPNGAAVLAALGLAPELAAASLRARAVVLRDGRRGGPVLRIPLPADGAGFHLVHRADLVALLAEAARAAGAECLLGAQALALDPHGPRPRAVLQDGRTLDSDLLAGADGLHSCLRETLLGPARPAFTGQVAWRALIPGDPDDAPEAQVFMGPGRHLVSYPLRGGHLRNIVAVEERSAWAEEGWNIRDDAEHLRTAFAGFGGPVPGWLAQVRDPWLWGLFRHPVAPNWFLGHGVLLGDAAHPTLPFMAQGANMALEDAWVLAAMLCRHADIPRALAAYQTARDGRARRIVAAANANARNYHLRAPLRPLAHLALRIGGHIAPRAPLRRFAWLWEHDVTRAHPLP
ncbi:MAG: FAD-dependent monooxygenase [Rhodobacteraceae bacterium]|nr:FAD-dependent monooxygenase [Paracoccaceae bacterium]